MYLITNWWSWSEDFVVSTTPPINDLFHYTKFVMLNTNCKPPM